jgi:hypothetical protein
LRRRLLFWLGLAVLVLAARAVLPPANLGCAVPELLSPAPDGQASLAICRRPLWFAMPGQGGDAPAWAEMRDARGNIAGLVDISTMAVMQGPVEWTDEGAAMPLVFALDRPMPLPAPASWLRDAVWRLRAFLFLVPDDADFR